MAECTCVHTTWGVNVCSESIDVCHSACHARCTEIDWHGVALLHNIMVL